VDNPLRYQAHSPFPASSNGALHRDLVISFKTVTRDVTSCGTRVQLLGPLSSAATS
jgi:hypothetical protein